MSPQWDAEVTVDEALARRLLAARFPELDSSSIEPFGAGWDNTAYLVNGAWVFRFPRRQVAVALMRNESAFLPELAPHLPLAIPEPRWIGAPSDEYPWPFAGYRVLPGRTACIANPTPAKREAAADALAAFLAALHRFPVARARELGLGNDAWRRLDVPYRVQGIRERLGTARAAGWIDAVDRWDGLLDALPARWKAGSTAVVHGDLYVRHLLVDEADEPAGVIDWGDVHVGDPACDLSIAHTYLPPSAHDGFLRRYREHGGTIDEDGWRVARMRALHYGALLTCYAHDVDDDALEREGLRILDSLADSAAS